MNTSSIKFRLITMVLCFGIIVTCFLVLVVPVKTRETAEQVMQESIKANVKLLADNLALGMQTLILDDGASLEQTLNLLQAKSATDSQESEGEDGQQDQANATEEQQAPQGANEQESEYVTSVVILDTEKQFVKGFNCDPKNLPDYSESNEYKIEDIGISYRVFSPMIDQDGTVQGYVEIYFSKAGFIAKINEFKLFIWIVSLIGLVGIVIVGLVISNSIVKPTNKSIEMLRDIASGEGDLTRRLNIKSKGEVGIQAMLFNQFVEKLQKTVQQIAGNTGKLTEISDSISSAASATSENVGTMKNKAAASTEITNSISSSLQGASTSTNDISSSVSSVASAMEEMSVSINEVAKNCHREKDIVVKATEKAKEARVIIDGLGESAKQISDIVSLIQDVSDQTNLLSLNATIEAARAGDAGKGFAVVASEVKELARQTTQAAEKIQTQVDQMQGNMNQSISAIEQVYSVISEVDDISKLIVTSVEEQSSTASEIASNLGITDNKVTSIAQVVSEGAKEIANVANNINEVNLTANDTNNEAQRNTQSVTNMTKVISDLQQLVKQFKV